MNFLFSFLYDAGIQLYHIAVLLASLFDPKARQWLKGRKNQFQIMQSMLPADEKRIWFHCASAGEFEQGRTVMEAYRKEWPDHRIVLTFFSPSGFELRKNYAGADYIFYLPLDTKKNARRFISLINPGLALFVKYEFWHNHLFALKRQNIPLLLISGIFRTDQLFFKWYGKPFRDSLACFQRFFLQDENSKQLLLSIGIKNSVVAGDTRFDRVSEIANDPVKLPLIEVFKNGKKVFVAGSTWEGDENIISDLVNVAGESWNWIIVPHEINSGHLAGLKKRWDDRAVLYSEATLENILQKNILIIDKIGLLSSLYYYADIAFVGGGFGKGIHNILEAAVYGLPVIFGPNYKKFREANELIALGSAKPVGNGAELETAFTIFSQQSKIQSAVNRDYVLKKRGATEEIMNYLRKINAGSAASQA